MKQESRVLHGKLPCPSVACGSSDAFHIYDDGHGYCYSCGYYTKEVSIDILNNNNLRYQKKEETRLTEDRYTKEFVPIRGLSLPTLRTYGIYCRVSNDGVPLEACFPYQKGEGLKIRSLAAKNFKTEGNMQGPMLFGMELFNSAEARAITITEGEFDAAACFEMLGSKYPCVSVKSAVTARKDCEAHFDYINSFDKIYLCFDNDVKGQEALKQVATLFDVNKVYHVKMDKFKDPNDYLMNHAQEAFVKVWWNSKKFLPKGIVGSYDDITKLLSQEDAATIASYPFPTVDDMAYGVRSGEVVLFTAEEKIGKTEIMRAVEHHLLKTTDYNLGIIHLEEKEKRAIQGLITYEVKEPVHLPDRTVSIEDQLKAYQELTKRDNRVFFYQHFGSEDPDVILNTIRYLAAVCHCKFIFLDHISLIVSGLDGEDERKKLDYISTRLAMMTRELDFTLFLVSHVNDHGQTRGSRNISKIADLRLHLERDKTNPDPLVRNTTKVTVIDNRFSGETGPGGNLVYDRRTGTLGEASPEQAESPDQAEVHKPF